MKPPEVLWKLLFIILKCCDDPDDVDVLVVGPWACRGVEEEGVKPPASEFGDVLPAEVDADADEQEAWAWDWVWA